MAIGTPGYAGGAFTSSSVTSLAATVPAGGVPAGAQIVVAVRIKEATSAQTCTDTAGNIYVVDRIDTAHATADMEMILFRSSNVAALVEGNTITVSWTTAATSTLFQCFYITGLHSTNPLMVVNSGEGSGTTLNSGNVTTNVANTILLGFAYSSASVNCTQDGDFTTMQVSNGSVHGYRILSAIETNNYAPTFDASQPWHAFIVGYAAPSWELIGISDPLPVASGNITFDESFHNGVGDSASQPGDLYVVGICYRSTAAFTVPSGFSLISQISTGNTDANLTTSISSGITAYMIRGSSPPSSLTFTRTGGDVALGWMACYRKNGFLGVYDTQSSATLAAASVTVTTPTLTTAEAEELLVSFYFGARNTAPSAWDAATDPTVASVTVGEGDGHVKIGEWSHRFHNGSNTGADCALGLGDAIRAAAGATGTLQVTAGASARHSIFVAAFKSVAVQPYVKRLGGVRFSGLQGPQSHIGRW